MSDKSRLARAQRALEKKDSTRSLTHGFNRPFWEYRYIKNVPSTFLVSPYAMQWSADAVVTKLLLARGDDRTWEEKIMGWLKAAPFHRPARKHTDLREAWMKREFSVRRVLRKELSLRDVFIRRPA